MNWRIWEMTEEAKETALKELKDLPMNEVDMVIGAWIAGMGFVLLLMGLNVWTRATCRD
jgi:hypothetical protein